MDLLMNTLEQLRARMEDAIEQFRARLEDIEERIDIMEEGNGKQYGEREMEFPVGGENNENGELESVVEINSKAHVESVLCCPQQTE